MAALNTAADRSAFGSWLNVSHRHLGVKFKINGEIRSWLCLRFASGRWRPLRIEALTS
jgi:hypothetical protein